MKYVCVLSTNNYLEGVLVLKENLKKVNSKYPLLCIINETIGEEERKILDYFEIEYKEMPSIHYSQTEGMWKNTFDKINIFSLIEYEKIVYLDCDMLIRSNIDNLFEIEEFTMASDKPASQLTNSSIMVLKPNLEDFEKLKKALIEAEQNGRTEIGDQDIIREVFPNANKLDNSYNLMRMIREETSTFKDERIIGEVEKHLVLPCNRITSEEKVIHYIFSIKPWMINKPYDDKYYYEYKELLDTARMKKTKYDISKKSLLVISNFTKFEDKERKMIQSLKEQVFSNITYLFISDSIEELNNYIDSIQLKNVTCLTECNNLEEWYQKYDYITQIEPVLYLTDNCYEECIKQMMLYDLDCIQFDSDTAYDFNFYIYADEAIKNDDYSITDKQYDKIYKNEYINNKDAIHTIGVLGYAYYTLLEK